MRSRMQSSAMILITKMARRLFVGRDKGDLVEKETWIHGEFAQSAGSKSEATIQCVILSMRGTLALGNM
jgi:hypothetical protein